MDYLHKGRQMESLAKEAMRENFIGKDIKPALERVSEVKYRDWLGNEALKDAGLVSFYEVAGKMARFYFYPLLQRLEVADTMSERDGVIKEMLEYIHPDLQSILKIMDARDIGDLPEDVKKNFIGKSKGFCSEAGGKLLAVQAGEQLIWGYTCPHKANRKYYCRIYFRRNRRQVYSVMDIGFLLGILGTISFLVEDMDAALNIEDEQDYVALNIQHLLELFYREFFENFSKSERSTEFLQYVLVSDKNKEFIRNIYPKMLNWNETMRKGKIPKQLLWQLCFARHGDATYTEEGMYLVFVSAWLSGIFGQVSLYRAARQYQEGSRAEYSRSFETKKNISEKMLRYMEQSEFNHIFGYIEVDEDCDTKKIDLLYKQFSQFKEEYFKNLDCSLITLRFRKLGHHHALGLYYPDFRCICIDITGMGSMVHEFGHMMDYQLGKLSLQKEFIPILYRYQMLLRSLPKDTFNSGSKYNLAYYLTPTEVFARCMEMYFAKEKTIQADILSELEGPAYPKDQQLQGLIRRYFDGLIYS